MPPNAGPLYPSDTASPVGGLKDPRVPDGDAPVAIAQIRAARGLLRWTQVTLAQRAGLSAVTLNMIENEAVRPRHTTLAAIRRALERAGVLFLEEDGAGVGVRFAPGWHAPKRHVPG